MIIDQSEDDKNNILYLEDRLQILEDTIIILGKILMQSTEMIAPGYREKMLERVPQIKEDKIWGEIFECQ